MNNTEPAMAHHKRQGRLRLLAATVCSLAVAAATVVVGSAPASAVDEGTMLWSAEYDNEMEIFLSNENNVEGRVELAGNDTSASWGPAGAGITFASNVGQANMGAAGREIYVIYGNAVNRLTNNDRQDEHPDFSPKGDRIAFTTILPNGTHQIRTMNVDGSNKTVLTGSGNLDSNWEPSWSHDGEKIVFLSNRLGAYSIFQMDADGSNQEHIYTPPWEDMAVNHPTYSPSNGRILFTMSVLGEKEVYWLTLGANMITRVTDTEGFHESAPVYSPDGRTIAFAGRTDSADHAIYLMDHRGGNVRRVSELGRYANWPDWLYPSLQEEHPNPMPPNQIPDPPIAEPELGADEQGPAIQMAGKPKKGRTHPSRKVKRFSGTTFDLSGVEKVELSVKTKKRGKCRHLKPNGDLTNPKTCRSRFKTVATESGQFARKVQPLPTGQYRVVVQAKDTTGNTSKLRYRFRIR